MKRTVICLIAWAVSLMFTLPVNGQEQNAGKKAEQTPVVVFVCEHGAAKSIASAAYFNKLAAERGLSFRAIARGTNPDQELAPKVVEGLKADGLRASEAAPKKISAADLVNARRVITFCALPDGYAGAVKVESWDGVPSVGEDYGKAREWLMERLNRLLEELKPEK